MHREYPGKKDVIVYDYVDIHIPVLERMYHKRLTGYAQIGYKVLAAQNKPDKVSMIYGLNTYEPVIKNDFAGARKGILIASPYIRQKQIATTLEWLKEPMQTGIPITVLTRPAESYKDQERVSKYINHLQTKVNVIIKADIHQNYTIIDDRLVWYGSISLLDYSNSDDTIMRLESKELVDELETMINQEEKKEPGSH